MNKLNEYEYLCDERYEVKGEVKEWKYKLYDKLVRLLWIKLKSHIYPNYLTINPVKTHHCFIIPYLHITVILYWHTIILNNILFYIYL